MQQLLAHLGESATPLLSQSQLPVVGNWLSASLIVLGMILFVTVLYFILDRTIRRRHGRGMSDYAQLFLSRIMVGVIFGAAAAGGWDIWWHRAVGRDDFFIPPHLFLYSFVLLAIFLAEYGWYHTRNNRWKHLANVLMIIPIIAPFDNLWHVWFGVEDLSHPINLVWAPPHMLLSLVTITALVLLFPMLQKAKVGTVRSFFGHLIFALIFGLVSFFVVPFHPTEGWGQVIGFWGAGVMTIVYVGMMMAAQRHVRSGIDATMVTVFALIMLFISYGTETAPGVILMPHDRLPMWLLIFSYLLAAVILDLTKDRLPDWFRGGLAGAVWAYVLFGFARFFFEPAFSYPSIQGLIAVGASFIGGSLVASLMSVSSRKVLQAVRANI
ncbi:MAG: hypothetical protein AAB483_01620 [Patescibacteria group bacterium]